MKRRQSEHGLQIAVVHMLELVLDPERTWYSSIDHGVGRLGPAEAGIRRKRGVKPGIPDIVIMWPNGNMIGVELKSAKGYLSVEQLRLHTAWEAMGFDVNVVRSLEEMQGLLEIYGVPLRRRMNLFSAKEANHEQPAVRPQTARHKRPPRRRRPAGAVPAM